MNVYVKFRNFPLRINKALGIFRIGVTRRRKRTTTTTRVAIRDAFQRLKTLEEEILHTVFAKGDIQSTVSDSIQPLLHQFYCDL